MKNLIIPTDFSKVASYAFEVACTLAQSYHASLHILHVEDPQSANSTLPNQAETSVHDQLLILKAEANKLEIPCEIYFRTGSINNQLQDLIDQIDPYLIIMGSHGKGGAIKESWGSNTLKAIRTIHRDILVVKSDRKGWTPSHVAFASNFDQSQQRPFKALLNLLQPFAIVKMHLVAINTPDYFSQPSLVMNEALKEFRSLAGNIPTRTHFYRSNTIKKGISAFVDAHQIDLLVVASHPKNQWIRWVVGSRTEALVNEVACPLLRIHN